MAENESTPTIRDIVDATGPPAPPEYEEFDSNSTNDFDLVGFAEYAQEKSGTAGGIGVALDTLNALSDDLERFAQTGAAPGELEFHAKTVGDLAHIIYNIVQSEADSFEEPLYKSKDLESEISKFEKGADVKNGEIPDEHLAKIKVDRISSSDNIIAEPIGSGPDHIHVKNGSVGDTVIAYHPAGTLNKTGGKDKPYTLPYDSKSEAQAHHSPLYPIPLTEGQYVQLHNISENDGVIDVEGFEVDKFNVNKEVSDGNTVLLKIQKISDREGEANIRSVSVPRSRSISRSTLKSISKSTSKSTSKSSGHDIAQVTGGPVGSKNDLISNRKL
jgi:hypothetical protein